MIQIGHASQFARQLLVQSAKTLGECKCDRRGWHPFTLAQLGTSLGDNFQQIDNLEEKQANYFEVI